MEEYKYSEITGKIIGAAMEVHKFLGNGFQEVIYQRALAYELREIELNFENILYKELASPIGTRRADFVVEEKVLVELKALVKLEEVHWAQTLNYLRAYKLEVGLLINFGGKSLEFKRFVLSPRSQDHRLGRF
jgi:GxxExxY protein